MRFPDVILNRKYKSRVNTVYHQHKVVYLPPPGQWRVQPTSSVKDKAKRFQTQVTWHFLCCVLACECACMHKPVASWRQCSQVPQCGGSWLWRHTCGWVWSSPSHACKGETQRELNIPWLFQSFNSKASISSSSTINFIKNSKKICKGAKFPLWLTLVCSPAFVWPDAGRRCKTNQLSNQLSRIFRPFVENVGYESHNM